MRKIDLGIQASIQSNEERTDFALQIFINGLPSKEEAEKLLYEFQEFLQENGNFKIYFLGVPQ